MNSFRYLNGIIHVFLLPSYIGYNRCLALQISVHTNTVTPILDTTFITMMTQNGTMTQQQKRCSEEIQRCHWRIGSATISFHIYCKDVMIKRGIHHVLIQCIYLSLTCKHKSKNNSHFYNELTLLPVKLSFNSSTIKNNALYSTQKS